MRCTQIIGLTVNAYSFLKENQKTVMVNCDCPDCKTEHIKKEVSEIYASAEHKGMFDDGPELYKYQLKDNSWVYEYVQACPWSSGPCIFLALSKEPDGKEPIKEILWSEEEIDNC